MSAANCCLTLICHRSLEGRMLDHLLEHPEWVHGFSTSDIEGSSQQGHLPSVQEQVRGRSQRVEIRIVMSLDDANALLQYLKAEEANPQIAYWITPVIEFGRLA